jgi:hypothetical protein
MTQTCCYHEKEFVLARDVKLGLNWGEEVMQEVSTQDLNCIAENLRLAYQASCEQAKAG